MGLLARHDARGLGLRHPDGDAQFPGLGEVEEGLGARRDKIAHIHAPLGDGPVEGGFHLREGFELFQAAEVRQRCSDSGGLDHQVRLLLGRVLVADAVRLEELGVSRRRHAGQLLGRLRLKELVSHRVELLVEVGGVNLRDHLARLHEVADVHEIPSEVAAGAGVDGCLHPGLHLRRQEEPARRFAGSRRHHGDGGRGQIPPLIRQSVSLEPPRDKAYEQRRDEDQGRPNGQAP